MEQAGLVILIVAVTGFAIQCVKFVRVTLPENYGNNPGFGCFEMMVMPWLITGCVGTGLMMQSWKWGMAILIAGFFLSGMFAMLLARLFGKR